MHDDGTDIDERTDLKPCQMRSELIIGLDFDNTYTADVEMWMALIPLIQSHGHRVVCISARPDDESHRRELSCALPRGIDILLTGCKPKREFAARLGYEVDIWVDDTPEAIGLEIPSGRAEAALKQAEIEIGLLRRVDCNYDWLADAVIKMSKKHAPDYEAIDDDDAAEHIYALADACDVLLAQKRAFESECNRLRQRIAELEAALAAGGLEPPGTNPAAGVEGN